MIRYALSQLCAFAEQQLLPHFLALFLHRRILAQIDSIQNTPYFVDTPEDWITDAKLEQLRKDYDDEAQRSYRIVEKARAGLFMIGVTMALITAVLTFSGTNALRRRELAVLLAGIGYLVLSAICLTTAINVRQRFGFFLDDVIQANGNELRVATFTKQQLVKGYYLYGKLNQKITTIVANYVSASYDGMRNGIVLIALFFALVMLRVHWK